MEGKKENMNIFLVFLSFKHVSNNWYFSLIVHSFLHNGTVTLVKQTCKNFAVAFFPLSLRAVVSEGYVPEFMGITSDLLGRIYVGKTGFSVE